VRIAEGTIESNSFPPEHFDLIVSNLGINNFDRPEDAMAECHRILKRSGKLVMSSNTRGHMREFYDVFRTTLIDLRMDESIQRLETHINHRATESSLVAFIEPAGFRVEKRFQSSFTMRFADGSSFLGHHFIRLAFLPDWQTIVPPDGANLIFHELGKRLDAIASEKGELALSIPMIVGSASKAM
jgi:SAM-dependent methyltransferase